jgi:hypothetical protein
MKYLTLLPLALTLPLFACGAKSETSAAPAITLQDMLVENGTHTVKCGCSIDGIDKCGNYIEIDEQFVQIANSKEFGLTDMQWCEHGPAQAEAAGAIKDGKFVAASFVVAK